MRSVVQLVVKRTMLLLCLGLMRISLMNFIQGFDQLVDSGNKYAIQLAVNGLVALYQNENGVEPELITGRGATETRDVFRSQAEVIQAMNDPRYDRDPAYRQDVFD